MFDSVTEGVLFFQLKLYPTLAYMTMAPGFSAQSGPALERRERSGNVVSPTVSYP